MSTDFDTLLTDVLNGLADRAPDEAGVRAALARRRRPRIALITAAAAVLLVAVAVPALRVGGPTGGVPPTRVDVAAPGVYPVPLTATWLPPGYGERNRSVEAGGAAFSRSWGPRGGASESRKSYALDWYVMPAETRDSALDWMMSEDEALIMYARRGGTAPDVGALVDLADMGPGRYVEDDGNHTVSWVLDGWRYDVGATGGLGRADLENFVRGLRNEESEPFETGLAFGDLGPGATTGYSVTSYPDGITYTVNATAGLGPDSTLRAELAPQDNVAPRGGSLTVRGRPAIYQSGAAATGPPARSVYIDLGDTQLFVSLSGVQDDTLGRETLLRVTEELLISEPPNPWLAR